MIIAYIQGTNSIGALIAYGDEGSYKKGTENLTLRYKKMSKMTMV